MRDKPVRNEMTPLPTLIEAEQSVRRAEELMRENGIRHLPVMNIGRLVGIITEGSVKAALLSKWADRLTCSDIMIPEPYTVPLDAMVSEVVETMIEEKVGSALVTNEQGEIAGIFTTIDALRTLRHALPVHKPKTKAVKRRKARLKLIKKTG